MEIKAAIAKLPHAPFAIESVRLEGSTTRRSARRARRARVSVTPTLQSWEQTPSAAAASMCSSSRGRGRCRGRGEGGAR